MRCMCPALDARPQSPQFHRPYALELPCAVAEHVEMERLLADDHVVFDLVGKDPLQAERTRPAITLAAPDSQHGLRMKGAAHDAFPGETP